MALGRPEEARDSCLTALRCRPEHAEAHLWLALALLQLGKRAEAREHAARAVALRPELEEDPAMTPLRDLMF
jgi:Flp pilus assembly protein TadD